MPAAAVSDTGAQFISKIIELVNIERSNAGIPALKPDPELMAAAMYKCRDLSESCQFSHNSATYGEAYKLMDVFNIHYISWGENIASGQDTPEEVMNAWMESPGHRENILDSRFQYIGVGFMYDGYYSTIWSQEFIER